MTNTIDITPTWSAIMPGIIAILECGNSEGRDMAKDELMRVAKVLDEHNAKAAKTDLLDGFPLSEVAAEYNLLTDMNHHTEAAILLARAVGGKLAPHYLAILEDIDARHNTLGHMPKGLQNLRAAIGSCVLSMAIAAGVFE